MSFTINKVCIYNRSFSASEAADLYNGAKSNHLSYSKSEGFAIPQIAGNLFMVRRMEIFKYIPLLWNNYSILWEKENVDQKIQNN